MYKVPLSAYRQNHTNKGPVTKVALRSTNKASDARTNKIHQIKSTC